jgi:hypothetical protein
MERWELLYLGLGGGLLLVSLGAAVATPIHPLASGMGVLVGLGLLYVRFDPRAYGPVVAGFGVLAVAGGGYFYVTTTSAVWGVLALVGVAGLWRGASVLRSGPVG